MRRDFELVREILLAIEASDKAQGAIQLEIPDHDSEVVAYHVKLLHEAGLITAINASTRAGLDWIPKSLTWEGHEFLDAAKNDTVWNKAMTTLKDKAVSVPFEIVKAVVIKTCKDFFGVG